MWINHSWSVLAIVFIVGVQEYLSPYLVHYVGSREPFGIQPQPGVVRLSEDTRWRFAGLQAFRWFLRSEFSEENLAFWLACQDYRSSPESRLAEKASSIYTQFINPDAPQEVNLDSETRDALMCVMDEPATNMFDEAQQRIYCLMAKDSFPRFLRSPYCRSTLRAL
ncbi:regulator of G-protein signaling 21 isoform X1 [Pygocentrus nattereri]|uniref:Si:ch211-196h16.12 n=1 Tax=Pygocentrus nattereri TaxID=42514 RepID=A0AAR2L5I8_PYGNA|nr:regulator of G-protein signaling 21 isoform X1 [Pygocentrus nattereri]